MADGFDFSMVTKPLVDALAERNRVMERAAMWAIRETGRAVRAAAKAEAPVYKGGMSQRAYKRGGGRAGVGVSAPVSGLLRSSIKSSRMIGGHGVFRLTVGPRGDRVHLYAGKIEADKPYMEAGYAAAMAAGPAIWAGAVAHVMR